MAYALVQTYRQPLELCDHIAQYSLRTFAVLRALASWETSQVPRSCRITLSPQIWARYTSFEGVRYLSSLSNQEPPADEIAVELVWKPGVIDTLFVAENHLGIRDVVFSSSSTAPAIKEQSGVWWRSVVIPIPDSQFEGQTDVRSLMHPCGCSI